MNFLSSLFLKPPEQEINVVTENLALHFIGIGIVLLKSNLSCALIFALAFPHLSTPPRMVVSYSLTGHRCESSVYIWILL